MKEDIAIDIAVVSKKESDSSIDIEPLLIGWEEIANFIGIGVDTARIELGPGMNSSGYLLHRRIGKDPRKQVKRVCAFPSHILMYMHKYRGWPKPEPRPQILLIGHKAICKCMHVEKSTLIQWLPHMKAGGFVLKRRINSYIMICAFECQLQAFLVTVQGGSSRYRPTGIWTNATRGLWGPYYGI